jgi:mannonate dehydratase
MLLTFRWYAESDPVGLDRIRQIPGLRGIAAALYDLKPGEAWPEWRVAALREKIEEAGLEWRVVESIPVHEEIKYGGAERDARIEAWIESLRAVSKILGPASKTGGSEEPVVITYNFMPVFDWTRSNLGKPLGDGSKALAYDEEVVSRMDPLEGDLELPGWLAHYSRSDLFRLLHQWREIGNEELWANLAYFLRAVVPVAEECGLRLAIHPDDPPWPIFGIPRIITDAEALRRLVGVVDSEANALCLCAGSLGVLPGNDLVAMAREFASKTAFAHLRNVLLTGPRSFQESAHWSGAGSLDLPAIVEALLEAGYRGPYRPDHGRMIWGEEGRPGYGLYDRALGSQYLLGLVEANRRSIEKGR